MLTQQKNLAAGFLDRDLAIRGDKTFMYLRYNFFGSKFTKMSISQLWLAAGCSLCTIRRDLVPRVRKCQIFGAGMPRRYHTVHN